MSKSRLVLLCLLLICILSCSGQNSAAHVDVRPESPGLASGIDRVGLANQSVALNIPVWSFKQRGTLNLAIWLSYETPTFASTFDCTSGVDNVVHEGTSEIESLGETWTIANGDPAPPPATKSAVASPMAKGNPVYCSNPPHCPQTVEPYIFCSLTWDIASLGQDMGLPWQQVSGGYYGVHLASSTDVTVQLVILGTWPNATDYYWKTNTPDGAGHRMVAVSGQSYFLAADGSGWRYEPSTCQLRDNSGTLYALDCLTTPGAGPYPWGPTKPGQLLYVEDLDGNRITLQYGTNGAGFMGWIDTTGLSIPSPSGISTSESCPNSSDTATTWTIPGVTSPVQFCQATIPLSSKFLTAPTDANNPYEFEVSTTYRALSKVVLPNGYTYTFQYGALPGDALYGSTETYGDLGKVTLPTGGIIQYHWTKAKSSCVSGSGLPPRRSSLTGRDLIAGGTTASWTYNVSGVSIGQQTVTVTDPLGNQEVHGMSAPSEAACSFVDTSLDYRSATQSLKTERLEYLTWPAATVSTLEFAMQGALLSAKFETWADGISRGDLLTYGTHFSAVGSDDAHSVVSLPFDLTTESDEYGFFANASPTSSSVSTVQAQKSILTQYRFSSDASATTWNDLATPGLSTVKALSSNATRSTSYGYAVASLPSGNVTSNGSTIIWDSQPANGTFRSHPTSLTTMGHDGVHADISLTTSEIFTDTGELHSVTLPSDSATPDTTTTYDYSSTYQGAAPTTITDALSHSTTASYDAVSLRLGETTDPNQQSTTYDYYGDGRLYHINRPDTGVTTYTYPSANEVDESVKQNSATNVVTKMFYDGLGRKIQTVTQGACADGSDISVETTYDLMDRVRSVTNPHCGTGSYGTTYYGSSDLSKNDGYDALGRPVLVTNPDSTTKTWVYNDRSVDSVNDSVTMTDEAQHKTSQITDALGHLISVVDANGIKTTYTVNAFGDLTDVNQAGASGETARTRHFTYDSLGRLLTAQNPETGTVTYGYDNHNNLQTKTDQRGVTTTYSYDALNRLTSKSYSDGTESEYYAYDVAPGWMPDLTNTIGRLANSSNNSGGSADGLATAAAYSYDSMGRVIRKWQQTPSTSAGGVFISAAYNLAGNMTSLTYPSGRHISETYDSAGRLATIAGDFTNPGNSFLSSTTYHPDGTPDTFVYGNGMTETVTENSRLQPCQSHLSNSSMSFMDRQYFYGSSNTSGQQCNAVAGNNGNIWNINDGLGGSYSQNLSYDSLNRLTAWTAPNMAGAYRHIDYRYDSFGNIVQAATGDNTAPSSVYGSNNRLLSSQFNCYGKNGETGGYDASGNVLCTGSQNTDAKAFVWDAESRISKVWSQQNNNTYNQTAAYIYDEQGQRVRSNTTGANWREYENFNGQIVAEREQDGTWSDYIYAGTRRIARADNYDQRIVLEGDMPSTISACDACGSHAVGTWLNTIAGYVVRSGDHLHFRQANWTASTSGGIYIGFCSGATPNWSATDQYGNLINVYSGAAWLTRVVDLSSYAGQQICAMSAMIESTSGPGHFIIGFSDIAITNTDGTTVSIFARDPTAAYSIGYNTAGTNVSVRNERGNVGAEMVLPETTATYYVGDQVGTTSLLMSGQGWPIWKGEFAPFGQELDTGNSGNRYKFTGKERDSESGLDYFGARYYASNMGRFTSPDWADKPEAVPYSSLDNPQSLNLYGYVGNNPLGRADADGHDWRSWASSAADFTTGIAAGAVQSLFPGRLTAPSSSDSTASLAGQMTGSLIVGALGADAVVSGAGAAGGGLIAAPVTGGASLGVSAAGVATAAAGTYAVEGAASNAGAVAAVAMGKLSKPPTGPGAVPPGERDGKRTWTRSENDKKLAQQGGECANCGHPIKQGESVGHHIDRHADGGRTIDSNHAVVCDECHRKDLHGK